MPFSAVMSGPDREPRSLHLSTARVKAHQWTQSPRLRICHPHGSPHISGSVCMARLLIIIAVIASGSMIGAPVPSAENEGGWARLASPPIQITGSAVWDPAGQQLFVFGGPLYGNRLWS